MSYAPQNTAPDVSDALDGSLTTWYENINNCLKTSECVPGHYEYAQAPSYGNQCPIPENGSTKIDVACARFEIIDLNNSYIDCEFIFPLTIPRQYNPAANTEALYQTGFNTYYVGFKSAFDVISQYRIYSNGDLIYTQNHANYESFLNYISLTDSAKEKSPCFTTAAKIKRLDPNVPGTYIQTANTIDMTINITLTMKIPLNAFPILQNLKYYPGFMGRLSIEIYPSYRNLVWAMIDIDNNDLYGDDVFCHSASVEVASKSGGSYTAHAARYMQGRDKCGGDCVFSQINVQSRNRYYIDVSSDGSGGYKHDEKVDYQTFTCTSSILKKFHLYLAKYMIKMDVYNALEMNYLQIPLLFPIQTTSNVKFTSSIGTETHFTLQNTATLSHCDTIFVVFPANSNETTVSFNPEILAQLNINGKYYPREPLSTNGFDERFINLQYDALNINNNPLMTPGEDIVASLRPYVRTKSIFTNDKAMVDNYMMAFGDKSNFFFAVPLSTDEDFMGGISSAGSTVQIELVGDRDSLVMANKGAAVAHTEAPVAIFLEDKLLKIYSMKPPGKPQIQITSATLDQIVASGGQA